MRKRRERSWQVFFNAFVSVAIILPAHFVSVAFVPASSIPINNTNLLGPINASITVSHHCITILPPA